LMVGQGIEAALAVTVFVLVSVGLYWVGGKLAPKGKDSPGKHMPYACGEDLPVVEERLSYQRFFRLALMFVMVHMATLVIAMLPTTMDTHLLAALYLLGVILCVDMLERA